jgi:hypothetical protein
MHPVTPLINVLPTQDTSSCQSARKHIRLHQLVGLSVSSVGVCQTLERQHAGNRDVAREFLRRIAQSCSGRPSRIDMTKTKRSNGSSTRIAATGLFSAATMRLMTASPVSSSTLLSLPNDFSGPREHCKEPRARVRRPCSTEMKCVMNGVEAQ